MSVRIIMMITTGIAGVTACAEPAEAPPLADTGQAPEPCNEGLVEGECAPDFTLPEASGAEVALSDHAGSIVLVASEALW